MITTQALDELRQVRKTSPLLRLSFYCENDECSAREIVVSVKDYDGTLIKMLSKGSRCPICGTVRNSMRAPKTLEQAESADRAEALELVAWSKLAATSPGGFVNLGEVSRVAKQIDDMEVAQ